MKFFNAMALAVHRFAFLCILHLWASVSALGLGSPRGASLGLGPLDQSISSLDSFGSEDPEEAAGTQSQDAIGMSGSTVDAQSGPVNGKPVLGALLAAVGEPVQDVGSDDDLYGPSGHWQKNMDPNMMNAYSALSDSSQDGNVADGAVLHAMDLLQDIHSSEKEVEETKAKVDSSDSSTVSESGAVDSALIAPASSTAPEQPEETSESRSGSDAKASSGLGVTPVEVIAVDDAAPISSIMNWTDQSDKFWSARNVTDTKNVSDNQTNKAHASRKTASLVETGQRQMYQHLLRRHASAEQIAMVEAAKTSMFKRYEQRLQAIKSPPTPKQTLSKDHAFGGDASGEGMLLSAAQLREKNYDVGLDGELQYWQSQIPQPVTTTTTTQYNPPVYRGNALLDLYHSSLERRGAKSFAAGSEEVLDSYRARIAQLKSEKAFQTGPTQQTLAKVTPPPSPAKHRGTMLIMRNAEESRSRDRDMSRVARHLHRGELAARAVRTRSAEIWEKYRRGLAMQAPPPTIAPPSWRKREDLSIHLSARWQPTIHPTPPPRLTTPAPSLLAQYRAKLQAHNIDPYADADSPVMRQYRTELKDKTEQASREAEAELTQEQAELLKEMVAAKERSENKARGVVMLQQGDPAFMEHARKAALQYRRETATHNREANLVIQRGQAALQAYNSRLKDQHIGAGADLEGADLSNDLLQADGLLEDSRREIAKNLRQIKKLNGGKGVADQEARFGKGVVPRVEMPQSMLVAIEQYRHQQVMKGIPDKIFPR